MYQNCIHVISLLLSSLKIDEVSEDIQELDEHLSQASRAVPQKEKSFLQVSKQSTETRRKHPKWFCFYSKGVMGKKKYRSVHRSHSMTTNPKKKTKTTSIQVLSCSLPRLVPYNKLNRNLKRVRERV